MKPENEPISVPTESRPTQFQDTAEKLARSLGHKMNCAFTGCTCGAGEEQAIALYEYERLKRAASSSLLPVPRQIQVQCEMCDGTGRMHVTRDMAIDAGNLNLSGQLISCGTCGGDGFQIEQAEPNENEKLASLPVGESTRPLSELELRAIAFAAKAHSCQVDKAGHSYLAHPFRVAMTIRSEGEKYFAVGMLHDVPEDTDATLAEITAEFGPEIGEAVGCLTRHKTTDSYESDVIRAMTNPIGRKVKQADVADNERPERIGLLESATQERLRKKYAIAHRVFKEVAELGLGESREPLPNLPDQLSEPMSPASVRVLNSILEARVPESNFLRDEPELPSVPAEIESQKLIEIFRKHMFDGDFGRAMNEIEWTRTQEKPSK